MNVLDRLDQKLRVEEAIAGLPPAVYVDRVHLRALLDVARAADLYVRARDRNEQGHMAHIRAAVAPLLEDTQ